MILRGVFWRQNLEQQNTDCKECAVVVNNNISFIFWPSKCCIKLNSWEELNEWIFQVATFFLSFGKMEFSFFKKSLSISICGNSKLEHAKNWRRLIYFLFSCYNHNTKMYIPFLCDSSCKSVTCRIVNSRIIDGRQ